MRSPHYFYAILDGLVLETLELKRELFDAGYQDEHNKVAEAEAELRNAQNLLNQRIKIAQAKRGYS